MINKLNKEFFERLNKIYSKENIQIIKDAYSLEKRKPSFRVNLIKSNETEIIDYFKIKGILIKKVDFLENCFVLEDGTEKVLWDLDIFKQGKIYLQQITSQIPVAFLDLKEGNKVLDITAAPGSKTSQISSLMKNTGKVIAVDNNQIRVDKLTFTLKRQGIKNAKIIKTDARNIQEELGKISKKEGYGPEDIFEQFDNILFDAPCSAEGRFNFNIEKTYAFWNPLIIKKNYKLQKQILSKIIPLLKVGGTLVYSTCTLAPEENEAISHLILSNYPEMEIQDIDLNYKYGISGIKNFDKQCFRNEITKSVRILPNEETQGFYIAKFKKIK